MELSFPHHKCSPKKEVFENQSNSLFDKTSKIPILLLYRKCLINKHNKRSLWISLSFTRYLKALSNTSLVTKEVHNCLQCLQEYIESEQCPLHNFKAKIHLRWIHMNDSDKDTFHSNNLNLFHLFSLNHNEAFDLHPIISNLVQKTPLGLSCNLKYKRSLVHTLDCHQQTLICILHNSFKDSQQ